MTYVIISQSYFLYVFINSISSYMFLSLLNCIQLFATLSTVACQAPISMGFSMQEHWSEWLFLPLRNLHDPEIEPLLFVAPALNVDSLPMSHWGNPYMLLDNLDNPSVDGLR